MKKVTLFISFVCLLAISGNIYGQSVLNKIKQKAKEKANDRIDKKTDEAIDKSLDDQDSNNKIATKKKNTDKSETKSNEEQNPEQANNSGTYTIKAFQNYDFIAGDKIVFYDDFVNDQQGEFPSHWGLNKGQGTVNQNGDKRVFNILNGNYAIVKPLIKKKEYLEDAFTIEYDYFAISGTDCGYGANVFFIDEKGDDGKSVGIGRYKSATSHFEDADLGIKDLDGVEVKQTDEEYWNHWHHIAIAFKNPQMKVYIDQNRVLVVPNIGFKPKAITFGGIAGQEDCPISIANFRIANGGSQNMLSSLFTDNKPFITHGITFDIDKASIKPESMGVLNEISSYLKQNPSTKLEIDGHTDNSGQSAHNLTLSQKRADAVKTQLISMGVEGGRLSTKGFGDNKPLEANSTLEGKANNRRVEFIKK